MSTDLVKRCDVFHTIRDVKRCQVIIATQDEQGSWTALCGPIEADLSPRARKRALKSIRRALPSPAQGKPDEATAEPAAEQVTP